MATITLNRRKQRNAVGDGMREELADAYLTCDCDDAGRVIMSSVLPRLVGIANAAEILLTGATFDGHRAVELGLGSPVDLTVG